MPITFLIYVETSSQCKRFTNLKDFLLFRNELIEQSPSYISQSLLREIREVEQFEARLSRALEVPTRSTAGFCLMFGSIERTKRKIRYSIVRKMLLHPRTFFLVKISKITGEVHTSIIAEKWALNSKYHINQIPYP